MSMYNLVFGQNPSSDAILATLGLTRADTGRFRDCFVANGEIAVYTRNGGGNREEYQPIIDELAKHPCYLRQAQNLSEQAARGDCRAPYDRDGVYNLEGALKFQGD